MMKRIRTPEDADTLLALAEAIARVLAEKREGLGTPVPFFLLLPNRPQTLGPSITYPNQRRSGTRPKSTIAPPCRATAMLFEVPLSRSQRTPLSETRRADS